MPILLILIRFKVKPGKLDELLKKIPKVILSETMDVELWKHPKAILSEMKDFEYGIPREVRTPCKKYVSFDQTEVLWIYENTTMNEDLSHPDVKPFAGLIESHTIERYLLA